MIKYLIDILQNSISYMKTDELIWRSLFVTRNYTIQKFYSSDLPNALGK